MGLFSGHHPGGRDDGAAAAAEAVRTAPPVGLWADGLGKLATRSLQLLIVLAIVALAILGLRQVTVVVLPLLLALIIACAFAPVMTWLRRRRVPSLLATLGVMLGVTAILGLVVWLIINAVRNQWDDLSSQAREGFQAAIAWVNTLPFAPTPDQLQSWVDAAGDFVTSSQFGSGALAGASALANFITGFVLLIVVLFFFLNDGPRLWEFALRPFEGANYQRAKRVGDRTVFTLGSYVRGTATVAFVDAVGIGIALLILQVPLWLPLAVLVFLLAFIPIVGATLAGILAALVALVANGPLNALLVVAAVVLVNQLEGNFLQPVLMGRTMRLHSFVILIALAVGTVLGGVVGAVLAVPLTATVWGAIQVWDGDDVPAAWARRKRPEPPPPPPAKPKVKRAKKA